MAKAKKSKSKSASGKSAQRKSAMGKMKASKAAKSAPKKLQAKAPVKKPAPMPPQKPILVSPKNTSSKQFSQNELIECIRGSCGFNSRGEAKEFYGSFADMITQALKSGYRLSLPGLGKLQVKKRKARMGRNPMTQQPMMIPAKKKVAFTALKALKQAVL